MTYLLDTNIISDLRRPHLSPEVAAWASAVPVSEQYTSALNIAEIERGIVKKERQDPAQGAVLRRWLNGSVLPAFAGRILPFNLDAARILATYPVPEDAPYDDALIASVAQANNLAVVTRNVRHFAALDITIVNPAA